MSPSVLRRRRSGRPPRPSRGRNRPPQRLGISTVVMRAIRSRMPTIRSALVVTAVCSIATGGYFAFRDDFVTRPMTEMQITSEDHVADLRAQADRIMSQLDQGAGRTEAQRAAAAAGDVRTTDIGAYRRSISHRIDQLEGAGTRSRQHDWHQRTACRGGRLGSIETEISERSAPPRAPSPSPGGRPATATCESSSRSGAAHSAPSISVAEC